MSADKRCQAIMRGEAFSGYILKVYRTHLANKDPDLDAWSDKELSTNVIHWEVRYLKMRAKLCMILGKQDGEDQYEDQLEQWQIHTDNAQEIHLQWVEMRSVNSKLEDALQSPKRLYNQFTAALMFSEIGYEAMEILQSHLTLKENLIQSQGRTVQYTYELYDDVIREACKILAKKLKIKTKQKGRKTHQHTKVHTAILYRYEWAHSFANL